MTSSQPVPGLELTPPLARAVSHARQVGYFLAGTGALGVLAALASSSLLAFVLALCSGAGGAWLLWAIHHLDFAPEAVETPAEGGIAVGPLVLQVVAHVCELAVCFGRAVLKVLVCVIAGAGTGLITMGVFALRQPELWQSEAVRRAGTPFAPLLLGGGVGLLTTEVLLLALFRRSWGAGRHV